MVFKRGNPGCPCCDCPCACYKFDDNANDSVSGKHLTATNDGYGAGKLGNALKCQGTQAMEHEFNSCFSAGEGINVWFWIKREIDTPFASSFFQPAGAGIVAADGEFPEPDGHMYSHAGDATPPNLTGFTGSWAIFIDRGVHQQDSASIIFATFYENGYYTLSHGDTNAHSLNVKDGSPYEGWHFFYWWWDKANVAGEFVRKAYLIHDDDAVQEALPPVVEGVEKRTEAINTSEKFHVSDGLSKGFTHTGGTEYMTGDIYLDNLGICKNIGTISEMTARAAALYNSGNGLACNNSGR